ncbi:MAG: hypothetical protein HOI01_10335, partial [Proteobacteria bacterium]|nr:hypothetical protein [Pseudomonadota bacterium]
YRQGQYISAQRNYRQAIKDSEALIQSIPLVIEENNLTGDLAALNKDTTQAMLSYNLVLEIDPTNKHAKVGLNRIKSLHQISALIAEGAYYEKLGELETAMMKYTAARTLDPGNPGAESALQRIKFQQQNQKYQESMSLGFSALRMRTFSKAKRLFKAAQNYNDSPAVQQALKQAENGLVNAELVGLINQGHGASENENWEQAEFFYGQAAKRDAGLAEIAILSTNAKQRWDLDKELERVLSFPLGISLSNGYTAATNVLARSEDILVKGRRLRDQIGRLKSEIELAQIPVEVIIESDNIASITIYPHIDLGKFKRIELGLLPGEHLIEVQCDEYNNFNKQAIVSHKLARKEQGIMVKCVEKAAK